MQMFHFRWWNENPPPSISLVKISKAENLIAPDLVPYTVRKNKCSNAYCFLADRARDASTVSLYEVLCFLSLQTGNKHQSETLTSNANIYSRNKIL
jgi:hypothetical protein